MSGCILIAPLLAFWAKKKKELLEKEKQEEEEKSSSENSRNFLNIADEHPE